MTYRCKWCESSEILKNYHDQEWGKPIFDDQKIFEMLILEGQSCGLSWELVLKKRAYMRSVFEDFQPEKLINFDEKKIDALMQDTKLIRHRLKIKSIVENAKSFLKLIDNKKSFSDFIWSYVNNKPIINRKNELITDTEISKQLSIDLKKHGFSFVGPKITYSFMQSIGMIDDHENKCIFKTKQ